MDRNEIVNVFSSSKRPYYFPMVVMNLVTSDSDLLMFWYNKKLALTIKIKLTSIINGKRIILPTKIYVSNSLSLSFWNLLCGFGSHFFVKVNVIPTIRSMAPSPAIPYDT